MCCIDALAAGSGDSSRGKFQAFVSQHFPELIVALKTAGTGGNGAAILYNSFRNGFAHLRGPKATFAIAEDHELDGLWADRIMVESEEFVAINVDRLAREFLLLVDRLETTA